MGLEVFAIVLVIAVVAGVVALAVDRRGAPAPSRRPGPVGYASGTRSSGVSPSDRRSDSSSGTSSDATLLTATALSGDDDSSRGGHDSTGYSSDSTGSSSSSDSSSSSSSSD